MHLYFTLPSKIKLNKNQIFILYSQSFKGPRWFLPEKFRVNKFDFYKTKHEIMQNKPDAEMVK